MNQFNYPKEIHDIARRECVSQGATFIPITGAFPGWYIPQTVGEGEPDTYRPLSVVLFSHEVDKTITVKGKWSGLLRGRTRGLRGFVKNAFVNGTRSVEVRPWPTSEGDWLNIAGIGIEGCEMLVSTQNRAHAMERAGVMELRARMNGHRNISVYSWSSEDEVTLEDLATPKDRECVMLGAKQIY
jgi:hypothetical protein